MFPSPSDARQHNRRRRDADPHALARSGLACPRSEGAAFGGVNTDEEDRTLLELGVIADDLTGGVKVASLLEEQGVRCPVVTSADALEGIGDVQAVVVGRKLLSRPPEEAVADAKHSARALLAQGAKQLYYKYSTLFSSTVRGNIGPVTETLMEMTHTDRV
ncbi:MAG: hypothetical protein OXH09_20380, partial [Gammaproteobacteria bacterium]|nr:hypothetical protein [Gammaproteobacteria bacterium]